jgi:hypothetical protein
MYASRVSREKRKKKKKKQLNNYEITSCPLRSAKRA